MIYLFFVFLAAVVWLIVYKVKNNKAAYDCGFFENDKSVPLRWNKNTIPIFVYQANDLAHDVVINLEKAISFYNSQFKFPIMMFAGKFDDDEIDTVDFIYKSIYVKHGETLDDKPACATINADGFGDITNATIFLKTTYDPGYLLTIFKHELGHCLGLKHDIDEKSIMNPRPRSKSKLTNEDTTRLRKAYQPYD
mgnify:CR=1 FL=1